MSKFVGLGKGVKYILQKISGQKKLTGKAINKMPVAKNLKKTRDLQEDMVKFRDKLFKGQISEEGKIDVKTKVPMSQYLRKQNMLMRKKLASGGRVGKKFGGGMDMGRRKTNIQKIKETFGPNKKVPNKFKGFSKLPEKVQQKINAKLAKKV